MSVETFIVESVDADGPPFKHFGSLKDARLYAEEQSHEGFAEKVFIHAVKTDIPLMAVQMVKAGDSRLVGTKSDLLTGDEKEAKRLREWHRNQNMNNHVEWLEQFKSERMPFFNFKAGSKEAK